MEKIGIIFAMREELDALCEYLTIDNEYEIFDLKFYEGKINDTICILVESGVGKVNAARTTQILIDNMKVDCIFNIGVAGGVDDSLNVLNVVIGKRLVQHDFYIPNVGTFIDSDDYLLNIASNAICDDTYKIGVIASGDIFCTDIAMSNKINKKFNALAVEMEGEALPKYVF